MAAARKRAESAESKPKENAADVVVAAPLVQVIDKAGKVRQLYRGDVVKDVSDESLENLKSLGFVSSTDAPESSD